MLGFDYNSIISVIRDIAKRHTANHPYDQISTFAVIDNYDQLADPNFSKKDRDRALGHLWTKYPNECRDICLVLMQRSCYFKKCGKGYEKCLSLIIGVAQATKCVGCPENYEKTPDEVDGQNEDILFSVLNQINQYHWYKNVEWQDGNINNILATPEQMKCWKDEGKVVKCTDCGVTLKHKIIDEQRECFTNCIGEKRMKSLELKICGCVMNNQEFNVKPEDDKEPVPAVLCSDCLE